MNKGLEALEGITMSVFEDKQKMGLIPCELKNKHNVKTECTCFSSIISGLKQEEKYMVYEDNYYRLQEYKSLEKELGINLFTFVKVLKAPEIYFKRENEILKVPHCDILWDIVVNSIAIVLKENKKHTLYSIYYLRDYGKTWALTKEELL